jgi:L-2-hydroxyglutarate oxidase LhgO
LNEVDCIVVGAGVIGLAVARAVARSGREVIVIERERHIGMHSSSRNSEVIHAGIHYPPGSLKATLCVQGREALYRYCDIHDIGYRRCGKLTVAASHADLPHLERIEANARASGVDDLEWLEGAEAMRLEPQLECALALHSPSTGIVDSHGYMQCLLGDAESYGANVAYGTQVTALQVNARGIEVCIDGEAAPVVRARWLINCAGLGAAQLAAAMPEFPRAHIPRIHYAKGSYFSLPGRAPFTRLIYPAPSASGHLGIHLTLDLAGGARFGPDMQWLEGLGEAPDYTVDASRAAVFADAVRTYWPSLPAARLTPAYAGIRAKLSGRGEPARDFLISGPREHGVAGVVNVFGIDSPGLTSSLALGDVIAALLEFQG